jgi:flagellar biosynthetic protein FliR
MPLELLATYLNLPAFALVAARLGGLIMFQPVLGAMSVPPRLRVLLVLGLATLMTPLVTMPAVMPTTPLELTLAMFSEVLLGALMGLISVMCFLGMQWGGMLVAQQSGLAFGQVADPTSNRQETLLGVFYLQLSILIFVLIGGHRALVAACLDTFQSIPLLGGNAAARLGAELVVRALDAGGHLAFRVAAPALLALFLVHVALGFISRTMPQLNVLAIGFALKALLAFLLIAVSLPIAGDVFLDALNQIHLWIHELIVAKP